VYIDGAFDVFHCGHVAILQVCIRIQLRLQALLTNANKLTSARGPSQGAHVICRDTARRKPRIWVTSCWSAYTRTRTCATGAARTCPS
jgi:hypothetical protein